MSEQSTNDLPGNGKPHSHEAYALFRNKDYVRFLIGRFISTFGQQMFAMAVGWEIYERTRDSGYGALALACVGLTQFIPMILFTLPAGHVADNYNRKQVIGLATLIVAVANIGLTLISWLQRSEEHTSELQ